MGEATWTGRIFSLKEKQDRVFPSSAPLMDSMDLTSLKSLMYSYKYKSKFNVNTALHAHFAASSDTQAHVYTPGKLCITVSLLHFFTLLSMFSLRFSQCYLVTIPTVLVALCSQFRWAP